MAVALLVLFGPALLVAISVWRQSSPDRTGKNKKGPKHDTSPRRRILR